MKNVSWHEIIKGFGGTGCVKLLRYYGTKALRGNRKVGRHYYADRRINSRVSKPDLHSSVQRVSCHPEVPEARQHTGHLWNFLCHPEAIAEGSQKMQPRPRISNTRKLVLKFNPAVVGVSPLSEAHRKHTPHFTHAKRAAFTLAEVLITLAIIGIVAAMTIPTLSQKISDMQNKAIWKKKFSEISQVYTAVKLDNYSLCVNNSGDYNVPAKCRYPGDGLYVERTTMSPEFVNAMIKHFKVIDTCGFPQYGESAYCNNYLDKWNGLCGGAAAYSFYGSLISGTFKNLPTASTYCNNAQLNGLYTGWDLSKKAILLQDGSVIYFGGHGAPMISVDVNGFQKGPNVVGRDMFAIMLNENWIRPIGADGTFNKNVNGETCGCGKEYGIEKAQGFLGSGDLLTGTQLSGACCSYKYLTEK